jgi:hypothetical protein
MYKPVTLFILSFFTLCYAGESVGQVRADSISNNQTIASTISFFNHAIGKQSRVYNGVGNDPYPSTIEGNAYFMDALMVEGSIIYEGNRYNNIPLAYDLHADLLISYFSDGYSNYSFLKEKISEFDLLGHHFIHLTPDSAGRKVLADTFYDDLYDHRLQVVARHVKAIQPGSLYNNTNDKVSIQHFEPAVHYYLRKAGVYYRVGSEGSFIDVLKDHKKELKKYLKENKIKFSKDPEKAMQLLAGYYEQLTN